jgi:tetratricopeptide (TPR) repeat protein
MAIEQKDALFALVKSLSKSEKRQFKLYVGRLGGNVDANFMSLFNLLDKVNSYNDELILLKTNIKKQQISNTKAHLYKQILVSLRFNPVHQNVRAQIREQFDFAAILYNKGLYKQSLKILDKAKELAINNDENNLAYEIVEFEKVIESQYITRSLSNRADELSMQAKELSLKNVRISKLSNLSLQLYSLLLKEGYVKDDVDSEAVNKYFEKRLPKYKLSELGFKEKLFLYKAYLWHSLIMQDFVSSYKYAQKWVDLFEENPEMKKQNPVFYLKGVSYLLEALFLIRHKTKFTKVLKTLKNDIELEQISLNENTKTLAFIYYNQNKLNLHFIDGKFTEGLPFVSKLLVEIENYKTKIDAHHIMVFYYKIACMYFGAGKNEECIVYLEKIINNKDLTMREDLMCFSRVLNLVAHYDAGIDFNIEKLIVSTYKFLIKMNDLHEVQQKMIVFLKNLSNIYPQDLRKEFIKLHSELIKFENHPHEKRAFLYLDILSWLESKIQNSTVEKIIQQKAKKITK